MRCDDHLGAGRMLWLRSPAAVADPLDQEHDQDSEDDAAGCTDPEPRSAEVVHQRCVNVGALWVVVKDLESSSRESLLSSRSL